MRYSTKCLSILFSIMVYALLMSSHAQASEVSSPNSIVSYDLDSASRFSFGLDQENHAYYYCIDKRSIIFPWISYSAIYEEKNSEIRCVLRSAESISNIFVHNQMIYYVSHATLGLNGKLVAYDIQISQKETILPTSTGVGKIFGIHDNHLFCETDTYIYAIDLCSKKYETIAQKNYYVAEATNSGITFYSDGSWKFYSWQEGIISDLFRSDTPPVSHLETMAIDPSRYITLAGDQNIATLVSGSSQLRVCNALCASIDNNLVAILTSDNTIQVYSIDTGVDFLYTIPVSSTSQFYFYDSCIFLIESNGDLCIIELP